MIEGRFSKLGFVFILLSLTFCSAAFFGDDKSFDVDNALLKLVIEKGDSAGRVLKIISNEYNDFRIEKSNLDFVEVGETSFHLSEGEVKDVELDFDSSGKDYGVYCGELVVLDGKTSRIPVIMEVESQDVLFDSNVNVPLEYVDVKSGDNIVFENKIFNLENIGAESVKASYYVKSFDGKTIFSDEENIVVESQLLNSKTVALPSDLQEGNYLFVVVLEYRNSVGTSSYLFNVDRRIDYFGFGEGFFLWIVIVLLVVLVFFIIFYTKKRDDVLLELHREYKREIGKTAEAIEKEKHATEKLKDEKKKCGELEKIEKRAVKRKNAVKKIYSGRVRTVKTLRKHKRESEIGKRLKDWKKAGYNIDEIVGKKESVSDYKKQGYKL